MRVLLSRSGLGEVPHIVLFQVNMHSLLDLHVSQGPLLIGYRALRTLSCLAEDRLIKLLEIIVFVLGVKDLLDEGVRELPVPQVKFECIQRGTPAMSAEVYGELSCLTYKRVGSYRVERVRFEYIILV